MFDEPEACDGAVNGEEDREETVPFNFADGRSAGERSRKPTGAEAAPVEEPVVSSRSVAITLARGSANDIAYAATMAVVDSDGFPSDAPSCRSAEWCVDSGERLSTMSTFEAWTAIARGDVRRSHRVWREGMECWEPIEEVPELACALSIEQAVTPEPFTADIAPEPVIETRVTLVSPELPAPAVSSPARSRAAARWFRRAGIEIESAPYFVLGAAVASAALWVALVRPRPIPVVEARAPAAQVAAMLEPVVASIGSAPRVDQDVAPVAMGVAMGASLADVVPAAGLPSDPALDKIAERLQAPITPAERGQRRLRRGSKR
jgi:hypothetical protein